MRRFIGLTSLVALGLLDACGNSVGAPGGLAPATATADSGDGTELPAGGDDGGDPGEQPGDPGEPVQPGDGRVAVFVAQGHVGRTLMSCDDGKTWIHDRNDDSTIVCYNPDECDHAPHSAAGLTYGDGWFFASFGHGSSAGTLRRSQDGASWEVMKTGGSEGGVSFANGVLLWMQGSFGLSEDLGVTVTSNLQHVPGGFFQSRTISSAGNVIVVSGDDPGGLVSQDSGKTWRAATLQNVAWGRNVFIARGRDGKLLSVSSVHADFGSTTAYVAHSSDEGLTWVGDPPLFDGAGYIGWKTMFFDGTKFIGWFGNRKWESVNGTDWTSGTTTVPDGPIARGPTGTYVLITGVWDNFYAKQKAYRSADGVTWTMLDDASFTGGHPVGSIVTGYVPASACP